MRKTQALAIFKELQETLTQKNFLETIGRKRREMLSLLEKKTWTAGINAILQGISLQDGATAKERNAQIGGHKA